MERKLAASTGSRNVLNAAAAERASAKRLAFINALKELRSKNIDKLAAIMAEQIEKLAARMDTQEKEYKEGMEKALQKDEEDTAAMYLVFEENKGGGVEVATPGPTPDQKEDTEEVEQKDEKDTTAVFLIFKENIGGGEEVTTPEPTPDRSLSPSPVLARGGEEARTLSFKTPATLSPVLSADAKPKSKDVAVVGAPSTT